MIINDPYTSSPFYGMDKKGNVRTWPLFAGPVDPADLPDWAQPVPDELPRLVFPAPISDESDGDSW